MATSHSVEQTQLMGQRCATSLRAGDIIALDGPLGAGKTSFVRGLVQGFGTDGDEVSSPTFVLIHEYAVNSGALARANPANSANRIDTIAHIDAYRIASSEELAAIGFDELLTDTRTVIVIEWAQRVMDVIPQERTVHIELSPVGIDQRQLIVHLSPHMEPRRDAFEAALSLSAT